MSNTQLAAHQSAQLTPFMNSQQFAELMEQATIYASSDLVPKEFHGKPANVVIAMEMAQRLGAGWFQVIQNMAVIYGRPSFSASFLLGMISTSGRFGPMGFDMQVTGPEKTVAIEYSEKQGFGQNAQNVIKKLNYTYTPTTCRAYATSKITGEIVWGPPVSYDMAIEEGWVAKAGSKWQTAMRELMLTYRAGSFFARVHASDITLGLKTSEEIWDMGAIEVAAEVLPPVQSLPNTANPHRPAPAPAADPAPAAAPAAAPARRTRTAKPGTEKPAEAPTAAAAAPAAAQRGKIVFYHEVTYKDGESGGKPWRKYLLKYTSPDGAGEAATFSESIVMPLEHAEPGAKIAIETSPNPNPKYAPKLEWLEVVQESAPAADPAPAATEAPADATDGDDIPY